MLTRRNIIRGATCAFFAAVIADTAIAGTALADDAAALAFVKAIYAPYKGKNTKGIMLDTDAELRRYFEPSLAALISKDEKDAARRHDVPTLDGDPFIDAQDWEIPSFDIAVSDAGNGKATATVKFVNAGQPVTVALDLVSAGGNWRIHDITWQHDGKPETLRGLFKH
jgi:Protein of unknown function (DUF3828)